MPLSKHASARSGFSLIEVVLAIGIFLVTVLALVGLLGPTLQSVDEVEKTDEVSSVVNTLNAFLQSSPNIATTSGTKFEAIYNAVESGGYATIYIYRWYHDDQDDVGNPIVLLEVGFDTVETGYVGKYALVNSDDGEGAAFSKAAGTIYRAVLTPSSVLDEEYRSDIRTNGVYALDESFSNYHEGSFPMEVRIFAEGAPGPMAEYSHKNLEDLFGVEPIFTYNMAIVR